MALRGFFIWEEQLNINWKVRIRNKTFWLAIIPAILVLVQAVGAPFGFSWDFGILSDQLRHIVEAAFAVLTILGVVNDPTTAGWNDSVLAMTYEEPKPQGA